MRSYLDLRLCERTLFETTGFLDWYLAAKLYAVGFFCWYAVKVFRATAATGEIKSLFELKKWLESG